MKIKTLLTPIITMLAIMWIVFIANSLTGDTINNLLAVKPRQLTGLLGVFTHPFVHGSFNHILANSFPFLVLSIFVSLSTDMSKLIGLWIVGTIGAGIGMWLFSSAYVVGASGVVFSLNGFLLASCYTNPNLKSIVAALLVIIYYAGMFFALFNFTATGISWIGHFSGFVTGVIYGLSSYSNPSLKT